MDFLWNILHLFPVCFILSIQYSFCAALPLHGKLVDVLPLERLPFIVSINNKTKLHLYKTDIKRKFATERAHFCGGSLITTGHVLIAAHCFISYKQFNEVVIIIGSTNLRIESDVQEVSWWYTYSQYYNTTLNNDNGDDIKDKVFDIAIIKLMTPVSSDFPLPTIMYIPDQELYNKAAVMGGWGRIKENVKPKRMRITKSFILDLEKCSAHQPDDIKEDWEKMYVCTDASNVHVGKGDSGSPLLYDGVNLNYLNNIVGVNSGSGERGENAPGQFMNVHSSVNGYRDFIKSVKTWEIIPLHS